MLRITVRVIGHYLNHCQCISSIYIELYIYHVATVLWYLVGDVKAMFYKRSTARAKMNERSQVTMIILF